MSFRRFPLPTLLTFCVLLLPLFSTACADDDEDDEDEQFRSGVVATFTTVGDGSSFQRVDQAPAIQSTSTFDIDARLPQQPFHGAWSGRLLTQQRGDYRLYAYVSGGAVNVKLQGETIVTGETKEPKWFASESLPLSFGWQPVSITFETEAREPMRLSLFWSGPGFQLEPIAERYYFHEPSSSPDVSFERGALLTKALRCAACHDISSLPQPLPAPSLKKIAGNVHRVWLVDWLSAKPTNDKDDDPRRMPHFGFSEEDASALADFLLGDEPISTSTKKQDKDKIEAGRKLVLTRGCLACHGVGELGDSNLFGGGDLSELMSKRPVSFVEQWLRDPAKLNEDHRMPVFKLKKSELSSIAAYLQTLGDLPKANEPRTSKTKRKRGRELFTNNRCFACHASKLEVDPIARLSANWSAETDWKSSCLAASNAKKSRPGFALNLEDANAVQQYLIGTRDRNPQHDLSITGATLVAENNCLSCHKRGTELGLAAKMKAVIDAFPEFGTLVPAMTPPALTSVGDKLHDDALNRAVERESGDRRPWLEVRMPKFKFTKEQRESIVDYLVSTDRIPDDPPHAQPDESGQLNPNTFDLAGRRLVTTDGFGCTSCHQVGKQKPPKAPLNAKGPDLAMMKDHLRKPWFDRWVRNPARIVPRMEMPSVKIPVHGVLSDNLDHQLAAVWHVLNKPGFKPPLPNPVRVVRQSGLESRHNKTVYVTDVIRAGETRYIKPLLIGLPNRHSVLFDLEQGRIATWTMGDVARQRTEGKTWFWELAGESLMPDAKKTADISLTRGGKILYANKRGQFTTELELVHEENGTLRFDYVLNFDEGADNVDVQVTESYSQIHDGATSGFTRSIVLRGVDANDVVRLSVPRVESSSKVNVRVTEPNDGVPATAEFVTRNPSSDGEVHFTLTYTTELPLDTFTQNAPAFPPPDAEELHIAPGFQSTQLPALEEMMPTGLAWRPNGDLIVTSLKGRVWLGRDTDDDGLEDQFAPFSDELAAPFGAMAFGEKSVDVVNKYALLRLTDHDDDGFAEETKRLASGWGHTADYHDWAIGLPRDADGNYYVAIPCQQDDRSVAAAKFHGEVLKLMPNKEHTSYSIESLTAGHRFPIGIARNRAGDLFVTDNQGNYNPFNELNHVQLGKRYGFINKIDRKPGFQPELTAPAIDIPHPWTRSVNGICFLETPASIKAERGSLFGPLEGQLVGCEYDTRLLIRMSLDRVGDVLQGAAYPLTYYQPPKGSPLLGPLTCAVSPQGDLYVGSIRDSGWGGSNNIGTVVKMSPNIDEMTTGIAEVRIATDGFDVIFTKPIDAEKAANTKTYSISSYTRTSTPAYGGSDEQRRQEKVLSCNVSDDKTRVRVRLSELREGFVYEIRVKNVAIDNAEFFPPEAFYTVRKRPTR